MSQAQLDIQFIAIVTAAACALPGVFLVLRRMSLMSDAISHSILLGIVVGFFIAKDLSSPWLVAGATVTGVLTVSFTEILVRTRLLKEDASIGIVFPILFSIGVILIARAAGNIHLDTDSVILGEIALAPLSRFKIAGNDLGPKSLWVMGGILIMSIALISIFYKELKIATFDNALAASLGFVPGLIHYGLMTLVSVTCVGAFDAVGSILVVALMIAPPATAYLLTDKLNWMIILSVLIGILSAIAGYWVAAVLDLSIAGCMATMTGVFFTLVFLFAPHRGIVAIARRQTHQKWDFASRLLSVHLLQHELTPEDTYERELRQLEEHFMWERTWAEKVVKYAIRHDLIVKKDGLLYLSDYGRRIATDAVEGRL